MTSTACLRSAVLALAFTLPLAGCWDKNPASHIQEARLAIQKSDFKTAIIELKSALQIASDNAEARLLLGQTFHSVGQWANSEKELRKALELGMQADRVLPLLARTLVEMGKNQEAVDLAIPQAGLTADALASLQAEKASALMALNKSAEAEAAIARGEKTLALIDANAFSNDLQLAKARLAMFRNQPPQAAALLDVALQRDPKFIPALYLQAQLQLAERKTQETLKTYERIIAAKPNEVLAHLGIVELKLQNNELAAAEKSLLAAEKIDANSLLVKYARAKLSMLKGDLKRSNEVLQQVLRVLPNHLPALMLDAVVSFGLGNYERSLSSAQKVLGRAPGHPYATKLVAANELRRGNAKVALDLLQPLSQANPQEVELLSMLGEAYLQTKQYDKAMASLDRAVVLQPENAKIKQDLARGYYEQGRTDLALQQLEQVTSQHHKVGSADFSLISLYMVRNEFDKALQAIAAVEKESPDNPLVGKLKGIALLGKNDRAGARRAFERSIALRPDYFPAAANLARMDIAENRPDAARQRFESILKADAKNTQAMMALAELAISKKAEKEALDWMERAAKVDQKAIPPRAGLVRYHLAKHAPERALTFAREAVSANPDSPEALGLLASVQMQSGDKPSALSSYIKLAEKAPKSAEAMYQLGAAQAASKRFEAGRASFEKALALQPGHEAALGALLALDVADNKFDTALQRARAFQARNSKAPAGFVREGDILIKQKQYAQAAKAYEQGLSRSGEQNVQLFAKMQAALVRAGNKKLADQKLVELLSRHPKDVRVQAYAADYYQSVGSNAEALRIYENLRQSQPNATLLNNMAVLYQRMQDARALSVAEQAFKLAPNDPTIMDTLGWILLAQGETTRSVDLLKQAASKLPNSAVVRYHLAAALARTGLKAEAKRELDASLKSGSGFPEAEAARKLAASL